MNGSFDSELVEREARFRTLFETLPLGVVFQAEDGRVLHANSAVEGIFGISVAGLLGHSLKDSGVRAIREDGTELLAEELPDSVALQKGREVRGVVLRLESPKGRRFVEVTAVPLFRPGADRPHLVYSTFNDLTATRTAEPDLREALEHAQQYLDLAEVLLVALDTEGRVTFVNRKGRELLGRSEAELKGQSWFETCLPERVQKEVRQVFEALMTGNLPLGQWYENPIRAKDGSERTIAWRNAFLRDESGAIVGALSSGGDVSELREVQETLQRSDRRFRSLVENLDDVVFSLDADGRLRYISPAIRRFGYDPLALEGTPLSDLVQPEDRAETSLHFQRAFSGDVDEHEFELRDAEGKSHTVRSLSRALTEGDRRIGVSGMLVDITEQRRMEAQLRHSQRLEAVGRLAGGIAHDFNNLLTVIASYADLTLAQLHPADPICANVEQIRAAGEKASVLTRQLLAFSRRQVLKPEVFDLNLVVSQLEKMLHRLLGEKIELRTLQSGAFARVRADRSQIEQVLVNLAVNARDAMPDGGRLTIATGEATLDAAYAEQHVGVRAGDYIFLSVSDVGQGMDPETLTQIFEPFFSTKEGSVGLGLATVHGIVQQSGGHISVESELQKGTTFKVFLPRVHEAEIAPRPCGPELPQGRGETVLVVEDEKAVRSLVTQILEISGYRVIAAANGEEALLACEREPGPLHLLVTDVIMPLMSGQDLAGRLQTRYPATRVLFMSGYPHCSVGEHAVIEPDAHFLSKPFTAQELARRVRQVLDE